MFAVVEESVCSCGCLVCISGYNPICIVVQPSLVWWSGQPVIRRRGQVHQEPNQPFQTGTAVEGSQWPAVVPTCVASAGLVADVVVLVVGGCDDVLQGVVLV